MSSPAQPVANGRSAGPRAAIFDVDGTLVDSTYQHAIAWHRAFVEAGLDIPLWRAHRLIGMGGDKLVSELFGETVERHLGALLRRLHAEAFRVLRAEVSPLPGARPLLERLSADGWRVTVASSGSGDDTAWALDLAGVGDLVRDPTTGDDVDASKPDPDAISLAWQRMGRCDSVVVGDSVHDVRAAARTGLPCVTVRTGGFGGQELEAAGAIVVADDLVALYDAPWQQWSSGAAGALDAGSKA